jgi:rSAM/selenodomain-associated transferase 2
MEKILNALVLSIIIPTLDAESHIGTCLAALKRCAKEKSENGVTLPEIEIIVVDGGSSDQTKAIAKKAGVKVLDAPKGRGTQLNAGAEAARGDWFLFLHADTRLADGWQQVVTGFMNNPANPGKAAAFRFALDDASRAARWLENMVAWRCRALALPYGDQGLLISKALYTALDGFGSEPLMEDVDFVCRIGRARLRILDVPATTSAERYRKGGWVLRPLRNLGCLSLYFLGFPAPMIARLYGR